MRVTASNSNSSNKYDQLPRLNLRINSFASSGSSTSNALTREHDVLNGQDIEAVLQYMESPLWLDKHAAVSTSESSMSNFITSQVSQTASSSSSSPVQTSLQTPNESPLGNQPAIIITTPLQQQPQQQQQQRSQQSSTPSPSIQSPLPSASLPIQPPPTPTPAAHHPHSRYLASSLFIDGACDPYDTENNMRLMDKLYNANFYRFIRDEENVLVTSRHLYSITKDYEPPAVANAIRWLINGWRLDNVAKLMKLISGDWLPEICGGLVNLITLGWDMQTEDGGDEGRSSRIIYKRDLKLSIEMLISLQFSSPIASSSREATWSSSSGASREISREAVDGSSSSGSSTGPSKETSTGSSSFASATSNPIDNPSSSTSASASAPSNETSRQAIHALMKLAAVLLAGEPPENAAKFFVYLTLDNHWTVERTTELVNFLDNILEWDEEYFHDFTKCYMQVENSRRERRRSDILKASGKDKSSQQNETPSTSIKENPVELRHGIGKISFEYLAMLYKTNLALARFRLALTDYQMALSARGMGAVLRAADMGGLLSSPINMNNFISPSASTLLRALNNSAPNREVNNSQARIHNENNNNNAETIENGNGNDEAGTVIGAISFESLLSSTHNHNEEDSDESNSDEE